MPGYANQPSTSNKSPRYRKTMLFVLANGRTQEMPCKVVLTEPDIESWDLILDLIARNLDFPTGVEYLYTVAGDAIQNPRTLQNANIYVAVPRNEHFVYLDYVKVFRSLLPMREVDLKRIDMSAELPQQVNDPVVVSVAQNGGYNIVGKSKSDGLATIGGCKNLSCYQSKKRSMEVSQAPVAPSSDTNKQVQATTKPCGDVQESSPSATNVQRSTSEIPDNDTIKEEENLIDIDKQSISDVEFIQAWLMGMIYESLDESEDESTDEAISGTELVPPNDDARSDDGYLTSDEKDGTEDHYKREQETYDDFDDCRKLCMLKLGEESGEMTEAISTEVTPDSAEEADSDLSYPSDKEDDVPSIDLEFDDNMSVRMGSKDFAIELTVEEPVSLDEENSTQNSTTPVSAEGSSEKLDPNETSSYEGPNSISDTKMYKNDQHLFEENLVGPCKIPNCSTNRVPQQLAVYQSSCGRDRTSSTTNEDRPTRASNKTSQNLAKTVPKCSNPINNGGKLVNNNKNVPPRKGNVTRTGFQEGNRKDTKKSANENRSYETNQTECLQDCPKVVQVQESRKPSKNTDKTIIIKQNYAAYNSFVSSRYGKFDELPLNEPNTVQNQNSFCSPDDCRLKINHNESSNIIKRNNGTNDATRGASVAENSNVDTSLNKSNTVQEQVICSPEGCPLKANEQQISDVFEQNYGTNQISDVASVVKTPQVYTPFLAQASPISTDSTVDQYNSTLTPPNSLATTSSSSKVSPVPEATKTSEKHVSGKCEELCQPCPYKNGESNGSKRSKPQSVCMKTKNEETKTKAVRGSTLSVSYPNNKTSVTSSFVPKNLPVKRGFSNDYKTAASPPRANSTKTFKPPNQVTTRNADQAKVKSALCKTCPTRALADSKIKSSCPARNQSAQLKKTSVIESPKPNMPKAKQVKVEIRKNMPTPSKASENRKEASIPVPDEQDKKYCYPFNCKLKDKKVEKYCEPTSCKNECETKNAKIVTQEPELETREIDTTYQESSNASELSIIAEDKSEIEEFNSSQFEDNKKYCYRDTCKLKEEKPEMNCEPISCQDECQTVGMQAILNKKSDVKTDTTPIKQTMENSEITTDNSKPFFTNTCEKRKIQLPIQNVTCMPITCNDKNMPCLTDKVETTFKESEENVSVPLVRKSGIEAKMPENVPTQLRRSIPENEPVKYGQCPSKMKPAKQRLNKMQVQVPHPFKTRQKPEPITKQVSPTPKKTENAAKTRTRSFPQNEPTKFVQCTSKNKPAKQNVNEENVQIPCPFKNRRNQEIALKEELSESIASIAKSGASPTKQVAPTSKKPELAVKTKKRSIPQNEPTKFVQCTSKNKSAKQNVVEKNVQIPCPFKNHRNQEIALEEELSESALVETGTNPIQEVVPVIESAVVQTDLVHEMSTQYEDKQETHEVKEAKYCYLSTCQFKDRKQNNIELIDADQSEETFEFQADSDNATAADDGEVTTVIRKCNNCYPTEEGKDDNHQLYIRTDEREDSPQSNPKQPIESSEKYCYLDSCQVNNENAEDGNDVPVTKTRCKTCGVVQIVETREVLEDENENMGPVNDSVVIKESAQFIREGETSNTPGSNEDQIKNKEINLQPDWHNFSEELEQNSHSDFPDWRKQNCRASDCPIHLFRKSFARNGIPATIVEVDEEILLSEDLSGSRSYLTESEKSTESNVEPSESEQLTTNEGTPSEYGGSSNNKDVKEQMFHCPKCHVELVIIGDEGKNINAVNEAGSDRSIPVCESFLTKEKVATMPEVSTEDKVEETPTALSSPYQDSIPEVPIVTETFREKSLSKTTESNRIIFAPETTSYVSERESITEEAPLQSTASIQKLYKDKPDERKEVEQTPSQFISDIIRSSKVIIDKFKLKPRGLSSLGIKQAKCPDHLNQSGKQEPCCWCPKNFTNTNGNGVYENFDYADAYDLFIFGKSTDEEASRQMQPCVTTIENIENYSTYLPRFVSPLNFAQTDIPTSPSTEERHGLKQKNESERSSLLMSPTSSSQAAKPKVSKKQDDMVQPLAIRFNVQEDPSPDLSERNSYQSSVAHFKDGQHSLEISTGHSISEPFSLTTSTTTLHIVKGVVNRKAENCVPASLKEENQSKGHSMYTVESGTSRVAKCYCKEKSCKCKFVCLGRRLNLVQDEVSTDTGLKKSSKSLTQNGAIKNCLSPPSIVTPASLSGMIVGENSSEYNGIAPIDGKSAAGSPMASSSEHKVSLLQISPENQRGSFESMRAMPVVTDDKNKKE